MQLKKARFFRRNLLLPSLMSLSLLCSCQTASTDPWETYDVQAKSAPSQLPRAVDGMEYNDPDFNAQNNTPAQMPSQDRGAVIEHPLNSQNETTKIALLVPLSGDKAHIGQALLNAAQMAMFDGGMTNFEILPRDTLGTVDGARLAALDAARSGARMIMGPLFSHSVRAAKPIANRHNIPMVAFSTDWRLADSNTYIMGFLPFTQVQRIMEYSASQGFQNMGVFAPSNSYGEAIMSSYSRIAPQVGITTHAVTQFSPADTNISPLLRSFSEYDSRVEELNQLIRPLEARLEANAKDLQAQYELEQYKNMDTFGPPPFQAVLLPVGGEQARAIANLLSHYDLDKDDVKRLGTGLWDDEALATEQNLDGAWFAAPSPQQRQQFEQRYKSLYLSDAPRLATLAYDSTALAMLLTNTGGKFDRGAFTNPNGFSGVDGIFRFRNNGLVERGLAVLEYHHGKIRVIDPAPNTFQLYQY